MTVNENEKRNESPLYLSACTAISAVRSCTWRCVDVLSTLATQIDGRCGVHSRTEAEVDEVLGPERAAVFKPHYRVKVQRAPLTSLPVHAGRHNNLSRVMA